jgi:hypothetical protein
VYSDLDTRARCPDRLDELDDTARDDRADRVARAQLVGPVLDGPTSDPNGPLDGCWSGKGADIPGFSMSSRGGDVVAPGDGFAVERSGFQAAVQDADEAVGELA